MRFGLILAGAIALGTPLAAHAADPAQLVTAKAEQAPAKPANSLVVASQDAKVTLVKTDQGDDGAAKPRRGRVTTCRCGDQTPSRD